MTPYVFLIPTFISHVHTCTSGRDGTRRRKVRQCSSNNIISKQETQVVLLSINGWKFENVQSSSVLGITVTNHNYVYKLVKIKFRKCLLLYSLES
jgi:hypothetical protein